MWLIDPTLRALTFRTKTTLDDAIVHILRLPVFLLLFVFGVRQSLEVFPLPGWAFETLARLYAVALVIAIVYVVYRVWHEIVLLYGKRVAKRLGSRVDNRLISVFDKVGGVVIVVVGIFYVIHGFGIDITVFAAGGVLASMVIAFAAQDTLSNFFSGVHLLLDQPFKEGDDIMLDTGEVTTVTKIGLRSTHLYHVANHETIIVPNNLLATNRVINLLQPDRKYKVRVDVGVAYGSDVQKVKAILLDIGRAHQLALHEPEHQPFVRFQNFGASSLDFSLHVWIGDVYTRFAVASDLREAIDRRFADEGVEIPFPQQVLWDGRAEKERAAGGRTERGGPILERRGVRRTHGSAVREQAATAETGEDPGGPDAGEGEGAAL
jgi:MscS family membrane protein